jgi:hypothetical protein
MYTANLYSQGITAVGEPLQNSQTLVTPKGVIFNNKSIGMNIFNFSESGTRLKENGMYRVILMIYRNLIPVITTKEI